MSFAAWVVNGLIRGISHLVLRVNARELAIAPHEGPALLVLNHVNFLDAPITYTYAMPRPVIPVAKVETWDNGLVGKLLPFGKAFPSNAARWTRKHFGASWKLSRAERWWR
jgi:1-acyl-sn-glycerol-3-phosphate acyltransferase